ncbi:MAG: hypothetical protein FJX65_10355 [Alphaproteobacteria bacterium]|nr:hypothetical protein [Alphaproteobacteria bacterium]
MFRLKHTTLTPPLRQLAAVFVAFLAAACYETTFEAIPVSAGVAVPGLVGPLNSNDGASAQFTYVPATRDYRFSDRSADGRVRNGTARAMPIRGNIYALQVLFDGHRTYEIYFFQWADRRLTWMMPRGYSELAETFDVTLDTSADMDIELERLDGDPEDVLEFLRAHRELEFDKAY